MGKRNTKWSYTTYVRFLQNGRGQGELGLYKPWITTADFPSKGKVTRILGKTTGRIHHLLSQLEKIFFMILDNDPTVEDIKEQFPLPLSMTQLIAAELGIIHPCVNGFSYVMTTDFLYKQDGIWHAVQIKPEAEVCKERVQEKFAIEKAYYKKINIDWRVCTEKDLPAVAGENYYWLNSGEPVESLIPDTDRRNRIRAAFLELYTNYTVPFHSILSGIDEMCLLREGTAMQLFKSCILSNDIPLNLLESINLNEPRSLDGCMGRICYD